MDRRTCLRLVGTAGALGLAGCLSGDDENAGAGATESSPTPEESPSSRPAGGSATAASTGGGEISPEITTETSIARPASTPAPGECDATDPPKPSTGAGLPEARAYPEKPAEISVAAVGPFLEEYEYTHRFNRELAELATDGTCVEHLKASPVRRTVTAVEGGVTASVDTFAYYTATTCATVTGTATPTPLPHADLPTETARYYVTDRFLLREGVVVECWD